MSALSYRVLYLLLDPFVGSRVAIGSLCETETHPVFVCCALPDGVHLSGATARLLTMAYDRLGKNPSETQVENLGTCFALGEKKQTPRVADPITWLSLIGGWKVGR